jgi:TonB family protein
VFSEPMAAGRKRLDFALLVSFAAHVVFLLVLTHRSAPVFVMPSDVALGTPGSSGTSIVYLAPVGPQPVSEQPEQPKLELRPQIQKIPLPKQPLPDTREKEDGANAARSEEAAQGGSPYGSRIPGAPLTGDEIIPALPQVFPDPAVSRADLPPGVQGDVIVEVTIDEQGNVVELKLIRGIGYGIEDRVMATLRQWHFRPAQRDGVTIASQHIVSFHYPS